MKTKASRKPYLAFTFATMAIVFVQLARNSKLAKGDKAGAVVASVVVLMFITLAGEVSPELATGFATLLFLSVLLGGTDAVSYIFHDLPANFVHWGSAPPSVPASVSGGIG